MMLTRILQSTFFNNGLAILITVAGVALGSIFAKSKYDSWVAQRQAKKQTEAVIDRCTRDEIARDEIEKRAADALTDDPDNSFINQ